ncbi:MAG: hypothetical protein M0Z42_20995 [Actinomycetota bacterium]|nr:hypothetical protein [Actinomycetota bacterium]
MAAAVETVVLRVAVSVASMAPGSHLATRDGWVGSAAIGDTASDSATPWIWSRPRLAKRRRRFRGRRR